MAAWPQTPSSCRAERKIRREAVLAHEATVVSTSPHQLAHEAPPCSGCIASRRMSHGSRRCHFLWTGFRLRPQHAGGGLRANRPWSSRAVPRDPVTTHLPRFLGYARNDGACGGSRSDNAGRRTPPSSSRAGETPAGVSPRRGIPSHPSQRFLDCPRNDRRHYIAATPSIRMTCPAGMPGPDMSVLIAT